jgi:hypothetical protein
MDAVNSVLLDPKYHDILALVKGMRNGGADRYSVYKG